MTPAPRLVMDTNVVMTALVLRGGRLGWTDGEIEIPTCPKRLYNAHMNMYTFTYIL